MVCFLTCLLAYVLFCMLLSCCFVVCFASTLPLDLSLFFLSIFVVMLTRFGSRGGAKRNVSLGAPRGGQQEGMRKRDIDLQVILEMLILDLTMGPHQYEVASTEKYVLEVAYMKDAFWVLINGLTLKFFIKGTPPLAP